MSLPDPDRIESLVSKQGWDTLEAAADALLTIAAYLLGSPTQTQPDPDDCAQVAVMALARITSRTMREGAKQ